MSWGIGVQRVICIIWEELDRANRAWRFLRHALLTSAAKFHFDVEYQNCRIKYNVQQSTCNSFYFYCDSSNESIECSATAAAKLSMTATAANMKKM